MEDQARMFNKANSRLLVTLIADALSHLAHRLESVSIGRPSVHPLKI
jgi:hypothetical protein